MPSESTQISSVRVTEADTTVNDTQKSKVFLGIFTQRPPVMRGSDLAGGTKVTIFVPRGENRKFLDDPEAVPQHKKSLHRPIGQTARS